MCLSIYIYICFDIVTIINIFFFHVRVTEETHAHKKDCCYNLICRPHENTENWTKTMERNQSIFAEQQTQHPQTTLDDILPQPTCIKGNIHNVLLALFPNCFLHPQSTTRSDQERNRIKVTVSAGINDDPTPVPHVFFHSGVRLQFQLHFFSCLNGFKSSSWNYGIVYKREKTSTTRVNWNIKNTRI